MRNLPADFVNLAISLYGSAMKSPIFSPAAGKRVIADLPELIQLKNLLCGDST